MAAKWASLFHISLISAKIWKTTFPKEFFSEIWLIIGDHEYINIAEIKNLKFSYRWDFRGKTFFPAQPQNANLC